MSTALVVDDSGFIRTVVGKALSEHGYEVQTASDGREAVELVEEATPDVVTMDVEMPEMDGIKATERIMATDPTPIVMLSAHTEEGAEATLSALDRGAVDFIPKPVEDEGIDLAELQERLVETVEAVEGADVATLAASRAAASSHAVSSGAVADSRSSGESAWSTTGSEADGETAAGGVVETGPVVVDGIDDREVAGDRPTVVIAASTGGPAVVEQVLAGIPTSLDPRVLVVQHMPQAFTSRLAVRLDDVTDFSVNEATDGATVGPGQATIAKGDYHLRVADEDDGELRVALDRSERVHSVRPAADVTMASAAETAPRPLVGVVLTGMGRDGAAGVEAIAAGGGTIIVQDEATSPVFGMPGAAIETGCVDEVLPPGAIPEAICDAIREQAHA